MEIVYRGPVKDLSGYAEVNRSILLEMHRSSVQIALRAIPVPPGYGCPLGGEMTALFEGLSRSPMWGRVTIHCHLAPDYRPDPGRFNIGISMIETDRLAPAWVRACNAMDEVWVPSRFNREGYTSSGVNCRLRVMPFGFDAQRFKMRPAQPNGRYFTFLSIMEVYPRKGLELLLEAFMTGFAREDAARLIILPRSAFSDAHGQVNQAVERWARRTGNPAAGRVFVLANPLARSELPNLYHQCDCYVAPTRGEGWNLPVIEAMGCGRPVITTAWSGQMEYLHAGVAWLVPIKRLEDVPPSGGPTDPAYSGSQWALPDVDELRRLMQQACANPVSGRELGRKAGEYVHLHFTWETAVARMVDRLRRIELELNP